MGRDFTVCAASICFVFELIDSARYFVEEKSKRAGSVKDRADRAGALEERKAGKGAR